MNTTRIDIAPQPDDRTCGATCLHALYRHHGVDRDLTALTDEVPQLPDGGTLGVHLAIHALRAGFAADIYTYNLQLFDPSWFDAPTQLRSSLAAQRAAKRDDRLDAATDAYLRFLELGGRVHYVDLTRALLMQLVQTGPVLVGLSATHLYRSMREDPGLDESDPIGGLPVGHFVLLGGVDGDDVDVADPWADNPMAPGQHYKATYDRVAASILLSIVTYDANLVSIHRRNS